MTLGRQSLSLDAIARLAARRIYPATAESFSIESNDTHWVYPVPKGRGVQRRKNFDSNADPKYLWVGTKPEIAKYYYGPDLRPAVESTDGRLWVGNGEPAVWALYEAGIHHALSWYGETSIPASIADDLPKIGIREIHTAPDRDEAGMKMAQKLRRMLDGSGIALFIHELPSDHRGYDIGDAWREYAGPAPFEEWLLGLPLLHLPEAQPQHVQTAGAPSDLPSDATELAEVRRRSMAEAAATLEPRRNKGYYNCPLDHGPRGHDLRIDIESGAIKVLCKHDGEIPTRWTEFCEWRGVDVSRIAREVWEEFHPMLGHVSTNPNKTRRFPLGLPITLNDRLIGAHLKFKHLRIKQQHPAALMLFVWHELREILPEDARFTAGQFQTATEQIGRNLTRRTIDSAIEELAAWGFGDCTFCEGYDLSITERLNISSAKSTTERAAPGEKSFQFFPIEQQIANFERHWRYLLRELAFEDIPDNVQAEFADLTAAQIACLNEARRPIYAQYAELREQAEQRLITTSDVVGIKGQLDKYLDENLEKIRAGRYQPVRLVDGALENTKSYRQALYIQPFVDNPVYVREAANRTAMRKTGTSAATIARYRDEQGLVLQERTKVVAAESVTKYQRDRGLVIKESEGKATIRIEGAEMLATAAPEQTVEESTRRKDKARQRRKLVSLHRQKLEAQRLQEPSENKHEPEELLNETIPAAYSDHFLLRQLDFTPGAEKLLRYEVDLDTGVIVRDLTARELWRALLQEVWKAMPPDDRPNLIPEEAADDDLVIFGVLGLGGTVKQVIHEP